MRDSAAPADWLPDLCRLPALFAVMVVAEMVVAVLALAPLAAEAWELKRFAAASLFSQWLALTSAVVLCTGRSALMRLGRVGGALLAWAVPVVVAALGAVLVHEIDVGLGYGLTVPASQRTAFVAGCAAVAALIGGAALRYFYVQQQWRQQVQAQARAEVQALQARIRPHFLFNSMNSIAGLVRRDPATAERAIEDLSDLFRAALGAGQGESTLEEELTLCRRYLAIEALRLGERLAVDWELDPALPGALPLPRLILQPLVENAVVHGIARLADGGTIRIAVVRQPRTLELTIDNPAPPPRSASAGNAHAQASIAQRLAYHFGPAARMTTRHADGYYRCQLSLPLGATP
jgi:two-component system sensor histidine kinase AlgZ